MLIFNNGTHFKLVCPQCGGDNVGRSGFGEKYVHCFSSSCMIDIAVEACKQVPVTSKEELQVLSQEEY